MGTTNRWWIMQQLSWQIVDGSCNNCRDGSCNNCRDTLQAQTYMQIIHSHACIHTNTFDSHCTIYCKDHIEITLNVISMWPPHLPQVRWISMWPPHQPQVRWISIHHPMTSQPSPLQIVCLKLSHPMTSQPSPLQIVCLNSVSQPSPLQIVCLKLEACCSEKNVNKAIEFLKSYTLEKQQ